MARRDGQALPPSEILALVALTLALLAVIFALVGILFPTADGARRIAPGGEHAARLVRRRRAVFLLDDLVRPQQHRLQDRQAEGLGGLEVDDQLESYLAG